MKYDPLIIKYRDYRNYNHEVMCVDVRKIDWSAVIELNNVNAAVDYFNTMVTDIFDKHAPRICKIVKGKPCKWLNRE